MSRIVVRQRGTNPEIIANMIERYGVQVHSVPGLHAKLICAGNVVVVGSTNASKASGLSGTAQATLEEAAVVFASDEFAGKASLFVDGLCKPSNKVDPTVARLLAKEYGADRSKLPGTVAGRSQRRPTNVWRLELVYQDFDPAEKRAAKAARPAAERAAKAKGGSMARGKVGEEAAIPAAEAARIPLWDKVFSFVHYRRGMDFWVPATVVKKTKVPETGKVVVHTVRPTNGGRTRTTPKGLAKLPGALRVFRGTSVRQLSVAELGQIDELLSD